MGLNLLKGMGKAYQKYKKAKATAKMKSGTSTSKERLEFGKRDKDITSVPVSRDVKKGNVTESVRKGKQHFYLKNIYEVDKHKKAIAEGEKAKKKLKHMTETKRAFHIGKSIHPSDPAKGNK
jgi:hypothetical protein|tara:strand:+ start:292 stop:657 length:366 start_codon:yes stop_codon:yes gene_type:complete